MMWTQKPALNTRDRSQPESEKNDPSQLEGIRLLGGGDRGRGGHYLQDVKEQTLCPGFRDICAHPDNES